MAVSFYLTNATGQFSPYLTGIKIDNATAVTLTTPSQPNMLLNLVNFFMVPASAYQSQESNINSYTAFDQLKCNGPYCLSAPYTQGQNPILFSPNPYFYLGNSQYYSQVAMHIFQNLQSTEAALLAGQIDIMWTPGTGNDAQPFLSKPGIGVYSFLAGGTSFEIVTENYQASGAPFNNQAFRQGLAYGTDRDAIAQTMYGPGYTLVPYGLGLNVTAGEQTYPYNITAAKAMFAQAGMHYNGANLVYSNGTQVTVNIKFGSGEVQSQNVATLLAAQWIKLGINAQPELVEDTTLYSQIATGTFQLYVAQEGVDAEKACCKYMADTAGGTALQILELQGPPRSQDPSHYITPQIGQLMLQWYVTPLGSPQQAALSAQIQPLVAAQAAEIPLYVSTYLTLYNSKISFGDNSSSNPDNWTGIYATQNVVQQATYWSTWYDAKPASLVTSSTTTSSSGSQTNSSASVSTSVSATSTSTNMTTSQTITSNQTSVSASTTTSTSTSTTSVGPTTSVSATTTSTTTTATTTTTSSSSSQQTSASSGLALSPSIFVVLAVATTIIAVTGAWTLSRRQRSGRTVLG
jgi:ABC-type transport system substrate-binding protein